MTETATAETTATADATGATTTAADAATAASTAATTAAAATTEAAATTAVTDAKPADTTAVTAATTAETKTAPAVPDKYELKLPDAPALDAAAVERTAAFAKARGLSNDAAQAALELANTEVAAAKDAITASVLTAHQPGGAEWVKTESGWRDAALADPELGAGKPEQLQQNTALAKRAFAKFADASTLTFLETTGFGSHPAVMKTFLRIAKAMSEGSLAVPGAAPEGGGSEEERLNRMYPSMVKT